ncbi:uncharacterized protein [Rutidosis leptorrhynchoides]|uniref:uncharacterized protein n=1 Tax=Rutidosis leptorrhynchoides TaxID=125765 RepID=UPI003A9A5B7B
MVQKRQLAAEEYDVSSKHLKLENSYQLVSCLEFPLKGITVDCFNKETSKSYYQFENCKTLDHPPVCDANPIHPVEHNPPKPRTLIKPEDTYRCLLRCPPLKQVPIGPECQADIPEWCGYTEYENKFIGSSVILMPELDPTVCSDDTVGKGRTDCCCEDSGSLRCVRQHIIEARENLKRRIGNERFSTLGFDTMGDFVACKWTEEDEQLFHEVVYSNPASLGKNFWENLADAFPSRTNREIVSYYFNVFVLQRRAEQNRFDPMNADSDDDEWQGNELSEEEDDDLCQDEIQKYGLSIKDSIFDYKDYDFQDDSCTSSEFQDSQTSDVNVECGKSLTNDDFIFNNSDSKVWDVGYFSFPCKTDFLPTGSMIEEIFGVNSLDFNVTDNNEEDSI